MRRWLVGRVRDRARQSWRWLADGVEQARRRSRRIGRESLLVRLVVFGAALVALLLAFPVLTPVPVAVAAAVGFAVLAAARPGGHLPGFVMYAVAGSWLAGTTVHRVELTLWRLLLLSGVLYVLHTTAALAAVVPLDAVLPPGALRRCLVRAALTLGLSAGFAVIVTAALNLISRSEHGSSPAAIRTAAPIVGAGAVVVVVAVLMVIRTLALRSGRADPDGRYRDVP